MTPVGSAPVSERVIIKREDSKEKAQPLHMLVAKSPLYLLSLAATSLLSSILVEWGGMLFNVWSEPGSDHARMTLISDLQYLNGHFTTTIFGVTPVELAQYCARGGRDWVQSWFHYIGLDQASLAARHTVSDQWAQSQSQVMTFLQPLLTTLQRITTHYNQWVSASLHHLINGLDAALFVTQTFIVRVVVAVLSLPAFILIGLVCFIDGLVGRDLRRITAAIESSYRHHRFLPWIRRFFVAAWFIYLSWPGPVHPNVIFVPSMIGFGITLYFSVFWFKKYA